MKTTVEMPDELFRRAKAAAALRGMSMKEWLTNLLRREVGGESVAHPPSTSPEQEADAFVRELNRLTELVSKDWHGEQNAVAAVREQRRDIGE